MGGRNARPDLGKRRPKCTPLTITKKECSELTLLSLSHAWVCYHDPHHYPVLAITPLYQRSPLHQKLPRGILLFMGRSIIRGLQALSVQFRFAFSKPSSSQTRFLNRTVAAPAEVAHFCRYKKKLFFGQFAF